MKGQRAVEVERQTLRSYSGQNCWEYYDIVARSALQQLHLSLTGQSVSCHGLEHMAVVSVNLLPNFYHSSLILYPYITTIFSLCIQAKVDRPADMLTSGPAALSVLSSEYIGDSRSRLHVSLVLRVS